MSELTAHSWPEEGGHVTVALGDSHVDLEPAAAVEFGVTLIRLAEHARAFSADTKRLARYVLGAKFVMDDEGIGPHGVSIEEADAVEAWAAEAGDTDQGTWMGGGLEITYPSAEAGDTLRKHVEYVTERDEHICGYCQRWWPCPTALSAEAGDTDE